MWGKNTKKATLCITSYNKKIERQLNVYCFMGTPSHSNKIKRYCNVYLHNLRYNVINISLITS